MWDYKHLAEKVTVHNNARHLQSLLQMIVVDKEVGPERGSNARNTLKQALWFE